MIMIVGGLMIFSVLAVVFGIFVAVLGMGDFFEDSI